tara:strand:- start:265 stop:1278 length:1014 start_codon:yes stop_codon:yes gene_type:complete
MSEELEPQDSPVKKKKKRSRKERQLLVVSNQCKNCQTPLALDQQFCSGCGAKRMHNRLNYRNLIEDFTERFLNIENQFLKTFLCLFTKPEDVILGYIHGMRKRYMSAFSYFAVALTLSSLYLFVFRNWFMDDNLLMFGPEAAANVDPSQALGMKLATDYMDLIFDYQSVFSFLLIPLYAFISKVVFWNYKQFNFIEHVVIYLYAYSQTQIISAVLGVAFVWSSSGQMIVGIIVSVLPLLYTMYVLLKVFDLSAGSLFLKTFFFLIIFVPIMLLFFGVIGFIVYKLGVLDAIIEQFKEQAEVQKSLKEARKAAQDSISMDTLKPLIQKAKDTLQLLVP